jgi:phosphoglycerate kinase
MEDQTPPRFVHELQALCDKRHPLQAVPLAEMMALIPRADQMDLTNKRTIIIRADLDVPIENGQIMDDTRLRSCVHTIRYCTSRGLHVALIGHLGRRPELTFEPIVEPFSSLLGVKIGFVRHWFDVDSWSLTPTLISDLAASKPGSVLLLENVRRYPFELCLWDIEPRQLQELTPKLYDLAQQIRTRISGTLINESIAGSHRDFSSAVLPFVMQQTGLGFFAHEEFATHGQRVLQTDILIFSGLKANKLDDLEDIIEHGSIRQLLVGGCLAMALAKARGVMTGKPFSIGLAETDPKYPGYTSPDRVDQARRILSMCDSKSIEVHLPTDYILEDGSVVNSIPDAAAQLDIGPLTAQQFSRIIQAANSSVSKSPCVLYFNGTMGKFEDPRFENGTRSVILAIANATSKTVETYIGGGDARSALLKFGYGDQVTHAFTAGSTILKIMSGRAVPYLLAMYVQNKSGGVD